MKMADELVNDLRERLKPYFPGGTSRFLLMGCLVLFVGWCGVSYQVFGEWRREESSFGLALVTSLAGLVVFEAIVIAAVVQAYREYRRAPNFTVQYVDAEQASRIAELETMMLQQQEENADLKRLMAEQAEAQRKLANELAIATRQIEWFQRRISPSALKPNGVIIGGKRP